MHMLIGARYFGPAINSEDSASEAEDELRDEEFDPQIDNEDIVIESANGPHYPAISAAHPPKGGRDFTSRRPLGVWTGPLEARDHVEFRRSVPQRRLAGDAGHELRGLVSDPACRVLSLGDYAGIV